MRHSSPVTPPPATLQQEKGLDRTTRSGSGPSLAPHSKQSMLKDKDRKSNFKFAELVARVHNSFSRGSALKQKKEQCFLKLAHVRDEVCQHRKLLQISLFSCLLEGPVEADRRLRIALQSYPSSTTWDLRPIRILTQSYSGRYCRSHNGAPLFLCYRRALDQLDWNYCHGRDWRTASSLLHG